MRELSVPHRVVTTAGHVDHGKSTLLRALTGQEPDRLKEEQRRGLTIELGYVWGTFGDRTVAFVDVPGHERFIATMLAGTGASPTALFVVAADDGWSKQSAEHRDVLALLNVPGVATVITKADTVDAARLESVIAEVKAQLADTSLSAAPVVVTDAISGRGIHDLSKIIQARLAVLPEPTNRHRPRLFVDRAFAVAGAGAVVTGTLIDGPFRIDDEVRVLPDGATSRIRGMQALGSKVEMQGPGSRVALNLAGVSHQSLRRGDTIVGQDLWPSTGEFECLLTVLAGQTVGTKGAWEVYVGSAASPATVQLMVEADTDLLGARIRVSRPLTIRSGDRFVLRESGRRRIVAGGVVTDPLPARFPRGHAGRVARRNVTRTLASCDDATRLTLLTELSGGAANTAQLCARAGWDRTGAFADELVSSNGVTMTATYVASAFGLLAGLGAGVHSREDAEAALRQHGFASDACRAVLTLAVERKQVVRVPGGFVLPEHLDDAERVRLRRVALLLAELNARPFAPPPLDDVAEQVGLNHRDVAALTTAGLIVKAGDLTFSAEAIAAAKVALVALGQRQATFTASDARQVWGTTRKYAIPLLEYFDRTGVTRFDGQFRTLT